MVCCILTEWKNRDCYVVEDKDFVRCLEPCDARPCVVGCYGLDAAGGIGAADDD